MLNRRTRSPSEAASKLKRSLMRTDELKEFAERWPTWFDFCGWPFHTLMSLGFYGIGEGWRQLLWDLCVELEPHVEALNRELATQEPPGSFEVPQAKEKLGGLRFYTNHHSDAIDDCIHKAQEQALTTCMDCGQAGKLRTDGRWHVACDAYEATRRRDR
jgi:hypothetical protein